MSTRLGQAGRWVRQGLLTVGAVLGVICILMTLGAAVFGLRPLVFESGSMSPTIETGDLAISRSVDASSLRKGDIVSVPTGTGSRVTHRIVSVEPMGSDVILRLRGDANTATDATHYRVSHADRVLFHVPRLGYVVGWLSGPTGLFLLGLYAAFLLSVVFRRSPVPVQGARVAAAPLCPEMRVIPPSPRAGRRKAPRKKRGPRMLTGGLSVVLAVGLSAGLVAERSVTPTLAAWTDGVPVSGTSLSGYTVPAPDGSSCAVVGTGTISSRGVNLTWPANVAPLPLLSYSTNVSTLTTPSATISDVGSNKQLQVLYDPNAKANQSVIVTVTATAFPTGVTSWTSPTTSWKFKTGGNKSTDPTCGEAKPPASVVIAAPDGSLRTIAAEKTFITSTCTTSTVIFCGSYVDDSAVTMTYTLKRTQGSTVKCWTGSWTNPQTGGVCTTFQSGSTTTVNGVTAFSEAANQNTVFPSTGAGDYVLTVQLTDAWENVTTSSVSFTLTA